MPPPPKARYDPIPRPTSYTDTAPFVQCQNHPSTYRNRPARHLPPQHSLAVAAVVIVVLYMVDTHHSVGLYLTLDRDFADWGSGLRVEDVTVLVASMALVHMTGIVGVGRRKGGY